MFSKWISGLATQAFHRHDSGLHNLIQNSSSPSQKSDLVQSTNYTDIMTLPSWDDMMADPDLIVGVMESQGYQNVTSISDVRNKRHYAKGTINWTDGTSTPVYILGQHALQHGPERYRSALFNSRLLSMVKDDGVDVLPAYLGVADIDTSVKKHGDWNSTSLEIVEKVQGYTDMSQIYTLVNSGQYDIIERFIPDFDWNTTMSSVGQSLARFHAAGWMDTELFDQFYLKGVEWNQNEGEEYFTIMKTAAETRWNEMQSQWNNGTSDYTMSEQSRAVIQAIFDNWDWQSFLDLVHSSDNRWGFVHGNFDWTRMKYRNDDGSILIRSWDYVGVLATPATDLATLIISGSYPADLEMLENAILPAYYQALVDTGKVDFQDYTYEQLNQEYITYGFAQAAVKNIYDMVAGVNQGLISQLDNFVLYHNLQAEDAAIPPYAIY